jgi:hypothetical protein
MVKSKEEEYKLSTEPSCISCSNLYKDVCLRIEDMFSLETDHNTKFFNLVQLRKKCHLIRCLTCVSIFKNTCFFSVYNKQLITISECIRKIIYNNDHCIVFTDDRIKARYGYEKNFSFLIALSLEFLLLYHPYVILVTYGISVMSRRELSDYMEENYQDVISFTKEAFSLNFKKLKDCINYVKERSLSIGFGDKIDRKKFFEDLFKDSNFIDHHVEVYISKEEEIPIINVVTDIYREIHNRFKYIQETYYIKPIKYVFERIKIRSHQKFLKKNKRRKVKKS